MKFDYIREQKDIDKALKEVEKNDNTRVAMQGVKNKLDTIYLYSPIEKLFYPNEFELDGQFGGRLHKIAKVKNINLYYLLDSNHKVVVLAKQKGKPIREEVKEEVEEESFGQKMARIRAEKRKK